MAVRSDVLDLVAVMAGRWPQSAARLGRPGVIAEYVETLGPIAIEHARAAVDSWYYDGEGWEPSAGQIKQRFAELLLDPPAFGQVKAAILGWDAPDDDASGECSEGKCDGSGMVHDWDANTSYRCRCWPTRLAAKRARRARHPLIALFLAQTNPREFGDLHDRIAEAQIRQKWEAFLRGIQREITWQGIDPAGLPALERITAATNVEQIAEAAGARAQLRPRAKHGPQKPNVLQLVNGGAGR
jgi:hypothetical protein